METKTVHIEMDCIHNHVENTMTCSWLNGQIRIVVDFRAKMVGIISKDKVIETRDIEDMSIDEFMRIQEQCQQSAESVAAIDNMAV